MNRPVHQWVLKRYKDDIPCWVCENCGSKVHATSKQLKFNSYRRPNPKRKFDGLFCGEIVVKQIHDS